MKFEITLSRTYTLDIVREFDSEEEAEEFASNYSWQDRDATDQEDHKARVNEIEE